MRALALIAVLGAACMPVQPPREAPEAPTSPAVNSSVAAAEHAIFARVNEERRAAGIGPLVRSAALDDAARAHSRELAARGVLDHNSVNAALRTPGQRASAAGVSWTAIAENLAMRTGQISGVAQHTTSQWLDSPGHRRNLLDARYTHTGIGIAWNGRDAWYTTQLYVLPQGSR